MPGHSLIQILRKAKFLVDSSYKAPSPTVHDCFLSSFIQSFLRFTIHSFFAQFCELIILHVLYRSF